MIGRWLLKELRLAFIALQFLTRLPVPRWVGFEPAWLNASARHFPLVGLLVGAVGGAVFALGHGLFGPGVAAWLSIAATVLLTGGFHEDGLADTCDALGGAVSRERALEIMKDSRIGSYGALGLVLVIGVKAAALAALPVAAAVPALLLGHAASRAGAVVLIWWLPYAGDVEHAKAKPLARRVSGVGVAVAVGWVVLAAVAIAGWRPALWGVVTVGTLAAALATGAMGRWFRRRLGGVTGDALGAAQQVGELGLLLVWVACWSGRSG